MVFKLSTTVRIFAWLQALAIIGLSVVPASDRPVIGLGQIAGHFLAFAAVAATFAFGYSLSLRYLLATAFVFCGGVELMQIPLPTRHARLSDFIVDVFAAFVAIVLIVYCRAKLGRSQAFSRPRNG